jgi:hypothetical protein
MTDQDLNPPKVRKPRQRGKSLPNHRTWTSKKPCFRYRSTGKCFLGNFCPYHHPDYQFAPKPIMAKKYVLKEKQQLPLFNFSLPNYDQLPFSTGLSLPAIHGEKQSVPEYKNKLQSYRDSIRKEQLHSIFKAIR